MGGDEAFKQMVFARLVEPSSKEQVPRVLESIGVEPLAVRTLLRSLARCAERDWRTRIQAALYNRVRDSGDLSLVLYDVTTLYFEAEKEDDLRKVGFSKERRVDPQVTVGMLVDRGGFSLQPLQSVEVTIAGHTITAQPQLTDEAQEILRSLGLPGH